MSTLDELVRGIVRDEMNEAGGGWRSQAVSSVRELKRLKATLRDVATAREKVTWELTRVEAERDRARDAAVRLENELAQRPTRSEFWDAVNEERGDRWHDWFDLIDIAADVALRMGMVRPDDPAPTEQDEPVSITVNDLDAVREWSRETFGPGARTNGVTAHIAKELDEIRANPTDVEEWADVIILGFDGAWRSGAEPAEVLAAIHAKWAKNRARTWPDWRTASEDQPIEHDRTTEQDDTPDPWAPGTEVTDRVKSGDVPLDVYLFTAEHSVDMGRAALVWRRVDCFENVYEAKIAGGWSLTQSVAYVLDYGRCRVTVATPEQLAAAGIEATK